MTEKLLQVMAEVLKVLPQENKLEKKLDVLTFEIENLKKNYSTKEDEFLTIKEVCKLVKKGRTTLWHWGNKGILTPFGKSGKSPLYKKSDVIAFLSQKAELV